jgi:hypothetical protein
MIDPMEIIGPVLGVGAIIAFIVAGVVAVQRLAPGSRNRHLDGGERQMLEDLEARLGELDELKQRIGELEERVDFSERLLAKQPDRQRLGPLES